MLRVLTLSSLFPDASRPTFGPFVERQAQSLEALTDVDVRVVAPLGLPPLARWHPRYRELATLPAVECRNALTIYRPRFVHLPGPGLRFDAAAMADRLRPLLADIRREFAFDIIDAQFFWPDGPAAIALGRHFGVPVSIKARGADIHYWGKHRASRARIVAAGTAANGLLAVSAALKADMVALGMAGDKIMVHRTGVDHRLFTVRDRAKAKAALGITGPLIVSIGALIARKGQRFVIDALPSLPGATLVLIGRGEDEAMLRAHADTRGVADRVRFTGSLPASDIADWLAAADVMALATGSEGLANAWVEALACGTPVVTCDVGGARDVVDRLAAGRLAARSGAAFAVAIAALLAVPAAREDTAAAVAAFSWEANARALRGHLQALVKASTEANTPRSVM